MPAFTERREMPKPGALCTLAGSCMVLAASRAARRSVGAAHC